MPKISVIIPSYNVEKYIVECLNGLRIQSFQDYEVIICDDGSTDQTVSIVHEFAQSDRRFRLLELEHRGAGCARNAGLREAVGEYLYFLDADDCLAPHGLAYFYEAAASNDADVVVARSHYLNDVTKESSPIDFSIVDLPLGVSLEGASLPSKPFQNFVGWPWDKLFRADFIRRNNLSFQGLRTTNDACFVFLALCLAERLICIPDDLVAHRTNNLGSLEHTRSKSWSNAISAMTQIRDELLNRGLRFDVWRSYLNWVSHFSYWSMATLDSNALTPDVVEAFFSFMKSLDLASVDYYDKADGLFAALSYQGYSEVLMSYIEQRHFFENALGDLSTSIDGERKDFSRRLDERDEALRVAEERVRAAEGRAQCFEERARCAEAEVLAVRNSHSYRLGNAVLRPLSYLKRRLGR